MQLFTLDLSLPILLAAFSLCTSMLAVLGTVQLVVSAPPAGHHHHHHHHQHHLSSTSASHDAAALEVGLDIQKRSLPWWAGAVSPPPTSGEAAGFAPLQSRPPLSMAKLIMFRHAEAQRRANSRARLRLAQVAY